MKSFVVRKKAPHIVLLAAVLVLAFTGVAYASGTFTWGGDFRHLLNSGSYTTPNAGTHAQYTYVTNTQQGWYYSALWQNHWYGDQRMYESHFHAGVTNGQAYWAAKGTYHWTVGHDIESTYSHVVATVYFP